MYYRMSAFTLANTLVFCLVMKWFSHKHYNDISSIIWFCELDREWSLYCTGFGTRYSRASIEVDYFPAGAIRALLNPLLRLHPLTAGQWNPHSWSLVCISRQTCVTWAQTVECKENLPVRARGSCSRQDLFIFSIQGAFITFLPLCAPWRNWWDVHMWTV